MLRVELVTSSKDVRNAMFDGLFGVQAQFSAAVANSFPTVVTAAESAALVGAIFGAVLAAALAATNQKASPAKVRRAMLSAAQMVAPCFDRASTRPRRASARKGERTQQSGRTRKSRARAKLTPG
jgi:hypothetical protein